MTAAGIANVTGIGAVSCLGLGMQVLLDASLSGKSGLRFDDEHQTITGKIAATQLEAISNYLATDAHARGLYRHPWTLRSGATDTALGAVAKPALLTAYAFAAALQAAGIDSLADDMGIIFATTTAHMGEWEHALPSFVGGKIAAPEFAKSFQDYHLARSLDLVLMNLARHEFNGPRQVVASACAAGAQALLLAQRWLRLGKVRRCLVVATETLTHLTVSGFGCFSLLAPEIAAPFAETRCGINLSEAAVCLCLDSDTRQKSLGYISGGATTMDAFDMTRPHAEGRGIYGAMVAALADAHLGKAAIDWLYAHGTGTQANDAAEAAAIAMLFGTPGPLVSSTKAVHGHALAASGLLETAVALSAMKQGIILASANLKISDPTLKINFNLAPQRRQVRTVMKTTLGFGGVNAALVLTQEPRP